MAEVDNFNWSPVQKLADFERHNEKNDQVKKAPELLNIVIKPLDNIKTQFEYQTTRLDCGKMKVLIRATLLSKPQILDPHKIPGACCSCTCSSICSCCSKS